MERSSAGASGSRTIASRLRSRPELRATVTANAREEPARAAIDGRHYATPDDVKAMLRPVLTHRMILRPEAQMRGASVEEIIEGIAHGIPVPGTRSRA